MFVREHFYARLRRQSVDKARAHIQLNTQRQWRHDEPCDISPGISLPIRATFAQNEVYLETCNPGWDFQWRAMFLNFFVVLPAVFIIWCWYGFAVHPLLFGKVIFFFAISDRSVDWGDLLFGWLLFFPLAIGAVFMIWIAFWRSGGITAWFTYARGRIRFNRLTRKVYVLRPPSCGGHAVYDWERLVALLDPEAPDPWGEQKIKALALYHPPFDANDPDAKGEDCIFVGPSLLTGELRPREAAALWEYIRLYMEQGPTVDEIPADAPEDFKQVPRYLPHTYSTYCGLPSADQYKLEQLLPPGAGETTSHMISQATCSWPTFPKEWQSDSGLGEPEDKPVQTGAVMTALVYRAEGKLSAEDEVTFMTHWGTPEGLAAAMARREGENAGRGFDGQSGT